MTAIERATASRYLRNPKSILSLVVIGCLTMSGLAAPAAGTSQLSAARKAVAATGWQLLSNMSTPTWNGKTLLFHGKQGTLAVTPLSSEVVRVHFTRSKSFGWDLSYAVINRDLGTPHAKVQIGSNLTVLKTASLQVRIRQSPLLISFANADGKILEADDPRYGTTLAAGGAFRVAKELHNDEQVYGFGEKSGVLDKRGWKLGGYNYVMWNSDTFAHDAGTDPMYVSVPFYMVVRHGRAYGIFLDDTWRSFFDVGHDQQGLLTFGAAGGDLDYYFINGPSPKKVIERYTALTGRMPLPPLWALGYNQSKYSYYPEARVLRLANTFRQKKIPADVIWLDIQYQNNFMPFTWNRKRFPHPKKMIARLRAQGFRIVTIVDPHPKVQKGYAPYDEGIAGNYFVKNPDGTVYEGPVWPSQAKQNPGPSVFPDFTNPAARKWWGTLFKGFVDMGVAGIWNDMDEPAVFNTPTGTMPLDTVFDNDGHPTTQRAVHNVYGQLTSRATFEGLARLRPNQRPFVLTRASFAGGQRYAAVWTGDNTSHWMSLRQSLSTLMGLGISGFPFVGSDIGGFYGAPSGELYARWLQVGVFYPFMRSHSDIDSPTKEPWSFGYRYEAVNKRSIDLRYELLPYIYNVMHEASTTGLPALRPLFLEFPDDGNVAGMSDEFMFGDDLLVAPVLEEGATERDVYLPKGNWFDYWTGHKFTGSRTIHIPVTIDSIPMFVRGGGFIFRQPVVQYTGQMPGNPLCVLIAPARKSEASLYEDDGETLDYRHGDSMTRRFHQIRTDRQITVTISAPHGSYRPAPRSLLVETWCMLQPKAVSFQTGASSAKKISLPHLAANALAKSAQGWSFANGLLTIKDNDSFKPMQFTIERSCPMMETK